MSLPRKNEALSEMNPSLQNDRLEVKTLQIWQSRA